jgi:hypothetical protein
MRINHFAIFAFALIALATVQHVYSHKHGHEEENSHRGDDIEYVEHTSHYIGQELFEGIQHVGHNLREGVRYVEHEAREGVKYVKHEAHEGVHYVEHGLHELSEGIQGLEDEVEEDLFSGEQDRRGERGSEEQGERGSEEQGERGRRGSEDVPEHRHHHHHRHNTSVPTNTTNHNVSQSDINTIIRVCFAHTDTILAESVDVNSTSGYNNTNIALLYIECGIQGFISSQGDTGFDATTLDNFISQYLAGLQALALRYASPTYDHDHNFVLKSVLINAILTNVTGTESLLLIPGSIEWFTGASGTGTIVLSDPGNTSFNITGDEIVVVVANQVYVLKNSDICAPLIALLQAGNITGFNALGQAEIDICQIFGYQPIYGNVTFAFDSPTQVAFSGLDTRTLTNLILLFASRTDDPKQPYATNSGVNPANISTTDFAPVTPLTSMSGNDSITIPEQGQTISATGIDGTVLTASITVGTNVGGGAQGTYDQTADSIAPLDATDRFSWNVFDWRNYNGRSVVSTVKDQMGCGSCWDFAGTGNFEAATQLAYNLYTAPSDPNPGVDQIFYPNYRKVAPGGLEIPTDLSEQQGLDLSKGDCGGSSGEDVIRNVFMVSGGVPRFLETYPQCMNSTLNFNYGVAAGTRGYNWCVVSNAAGNGFGSFGYISAGSCHAGEPGNAGNLNWNTPQRTGGVSGNMLGCSFMSKIATDTASKFWTTGVSEDSNTAVQGAAYRDVTSPAYNPVAADYWSKSGSPLSQADIRSQLNNGVLGVYIYAASGSFQGYHTGVFDDPNCAVGVDPTASNYGKDLGTDHVVNIVGYGTQYVRQCIELNSITYTYCINFIFFNWCTTQVVYLPTCKTYGLAPMDYWIVKNSWSQYWGGEGGYIKIRSGANVCNMESYIFRAVAQTVDVTWVNYGFISLPQFSPWDPCFNSHNVLSPGSATPSLFKQLKCYSWLCNDNERTNPNPLLTWNMGTSSWNPPTPAPAYAPSVFNPDRSDNSAAPFQQYAGQHKSVLGNGYCASHLSVFCSLGKSYCTGPVNTDFTSNPEDELRAFADVFGFLFGLPLVPPVANDQACVYWRLKCLPHKIIFNPGSIGVVNSLLGNTVTPAEYNCVNQVGTNSGLGYAATVNTLGGNTGNTCVPQASNPEGTTNLAGLSRQAYDAGCNSSVPINNNIS